MIKDREEINVFDVERVLGDLPLDIIKENITTQIADPLSYESDYCTEVYETFQEAQNEFGHIDEYKYELEQQRNMFNIFIIEQLESKFSLGIDLNTLSEHEVEEMAKNCYEFFIVRIRENLSTFLMTYIESNKSHLSEMFDDDYKRKDVTTMNMKKMTKNKEDVLILSNLPNIINHVLELDHDPTDFLELCSEAEEIVAGYIKNANSTFTMSGNFVYSVLNELKFAHNDIIDEISSRIRLNLMTMITENDGLAAI